MTADGQQLTEREKTGLNIEVTEMSGAVWSAAA